MDMEVDMPHLQKTRQWSPALLGSGDMTQAESMLASHIKLDPTGIRPRHIRRETPHPAGTDSDPWPQGRRSDAGTGGVA